MAPIKQRATIALSTVTGCLSPRPLVPLLGHHSSAFPLYPTLSQAAFPALSTFESVLLSYHSSPVSHPYSPTSSMQPAGKWPLPCFQDLLADGFDVLEAVKATDVIDQDVGMDAPEPPATHVCPLLQGAERDQSWRAPQDAASLWDQTCLQEERSL